MDGQARVSGRIYKDVSIGGKTYRFSKPHLVGIYGEIEAWIIARKTDPLVLAARACKMAPPSQHAVIWEAAIKSASAARIASEDELALFWKSKWSNAFLIYKSLDERHAEEIPDPESAMLLMESGVDIDEVMANVSVVSGEDDVKNSSGPRETRAQATPSADAQPSADGRASTDSSLNATT